MCNSPVTVLDHYSNLLLEVKQREHHIAAAIAKGGSVHTLDSIVLKLLRGELIWFPMPNGFMALEVIEYPSARHMNVALAGGNLHEIYDHHDKLIEVSRQAGCSSLVLSGRRGWVRALRDLGWQEIYTAMALPINGDK